MSGRKWTGEDDARVIHPAVEEARRLLPERTWEAIKWRRKILRVPSTLPKWTADEDRVLRRNFPDLAKAAKRIPNRTMPAVVRRAYALGLTTGRLWHEDHLKFLEENGHKFRVADLHKLLPNRTKRALSCQLSNKGWTRKMLPVTAASSVPLIADIRARVIAKGMSFKEIGRRVAGTTRWLYPTAKDRVSYRCASIAVDLLGGELYVEWQD